MNPDYNLDSLIDCFKLHANTTEEQRIKQREQHELYSPGEPFPYDDSFSLPLALLSMCKEISEIKDRYTNVPK